MYALPSSIAKSQQLGSWLSPAAARRKYRQTPRAERSQISYHTRKRNSTARVGWDRDESEDGRRLAFDPTIALPGERQHHTPRLKRQEAFRIPQNWDISDTDIVVNDAELYRLGILYDDNGSEHIRGSGFCLDAITHKEPIYSIRQAKRAKKSHSHRSPQEEENFNPSIELLSTYLGDDAAIARFFAPVGDEEAAQLRRVDFGGTNQQQVNSTPRNVSAEPLSIIYELSESSTHSLIPTPAESGFLDLVFDKDGERYEDLKEDIPCSGDWALVSDIESDADQSSRGTDRLDTEADVVIGNEEMADPDDGAWVFLPAMSLQKANLEIPSAGGTVIPSYRS